MPAKNNEILPDQVPLRIIQAPGKPRSEWLRKTDGILVVIPAKAADSVWKQIPDGTALQKLQKNRKLGSKPVRSRLKNQSGTEIVLGQLPGSATGNKQPNAFDLLTFAGTLTAEVLRDNPTSVAILALGFKTEIERAVIEGLVLALSAHSFELPKFKTGTQAGSRLRTVRIAGTEHRLDMDRCQAESAGLNLARWLTSLPPNILDAGAYRTAARALAKEYGWKMDFLDTKKLRTAGAGAFLAVAQGNATDDAGIVHLRYRPKSKDKDAGNTPALALVGKGIIFDTGGTNLKPFKGMLDMHCDMAGSAVALGTLVALSKLDFPQPVDCWLAITENRISNTAYKSRDIVTASNGVTIEVIHTDAEGRMALADTLALAGNENPAVILDFATLTGSCVAALTERYSGALTNREQLNSLIIDAGIACGERVWPFPMDDDFDEEIQSSVADVLQCAAAGGGDHIQAARFLQRFIPDKCNWLHLDLSAATRKGGLAQVPTEITGFGVRYALSLILDNFDKLTAKTNNQGRNRQG